MTFIKQPTTYHCTNCQLPLTVNELKVYRTQCSECVLSLQTEYLADCLANRDNIDWDILEGTSEKY